MFATANHVAFLYIARILCGVTAGLCYTVIPMYIGEIASDRIRGALSVIFTLSVKTGILISFSYGPFVSFRDMAWLALIPSVIFLICVYWLPETPYYLLGQHKEDEAFICLSKLRGHGYVNAEFDQMAVAVKNADQHKTEFRELFSTKGNRNAFVILVGIVATQIFCGSQAVIAYTQTIFDRMGSTLDPSHMSIILATVQLISSIIATISVDTVGRRPLLLTSVVGGVLCNTTIGIFFTLERWNIETGPISWIPALALFIFIFCYVVGMATVAFAVIGEVFPKNLRAKAGASYTIIGGLLTFAMSKLFQVVSDNLGSDISFFGFAGFGCLSFPFVWFFVPETKGKSLDVILMELNSNCWRHR